jgi:hypothetical protein
MRVPDNIYLQVCMECPKEDCKNCRFEDLVDNVTWCRDRIFKNDFEYISKKSLLNWATTFHAMSLNDMERKTMQKVIDKIESYK